MGNISRRITVQIGPNINTRPYSKINSAKRAVGMIK
jgi:hypothetical protein